MVYNIYKQINIGDINEYNFILNEKNINNEYEDVLNLVN